MVEPAECAGSAFDAAGWPPIGAAGRDGSAAVCAGGGNWPPWLRTPDAVRLTKPTAPIAVPTLVRIPVRIRVSRQHRGFPEAGRFKPKTPGDRRERYTAVSEKSRSQGRCCIGPATA